MKRLPASATLAVASLVSLGAQAMMGVAMLHFFSPEATGRFAVIAQVAFFWVTLALAQGPLTFLADVQRMPSLIGKFIAIPAMRDYSYRVVLDRDGKVAANYPGAEDKVLWLQLDNGTLVSRQEFASADELRAALEKLPVQ